MSSAWSAATSDDRLGPWPPTERPAIWVLYDGHWLPGQLLMWLRPRTPDEGWRGVARWMVPMNLQYNTWVPAEWIAQRRDKEGRDIPAPPVPEGVLGMMPVDEGFPVEDRPPFE